MNTSYEWFPPLDRLYGAKHPIEHSRDIHQGDIYDDVICCRFPYRNADIVEPRQARGPVMLIQHPCDLSPNEKGGAQPWRHICRVAEDSDHRLTLDGETHFFAFPLPDLRGDGVVWYADFRFVATIHVDWLQPENRIAVLSEEGWHALQRRLIHYHTRILVDWEDLREAGEGLYPSVNSARVSA